MNKYENFIRMEDDKGYLVKVAYNNELHRYECNIYGVTLLANTYHEMAVLLKTMDFIEVEVIK